MQNKNKTILKGSILIVATAIFIFFGGWALTEWLPGFQWSMATIATVAGLVALAAGPAFWARVRTFDDK